MSSLTVPIPPDHGPACRAGNTDLGTVPDVGFDLGWVARFQVPENDAVGVQLVVKDATASTDSHISVGVSDVHEAYELAVQRGYEIVHPLTTEAWGVTRFFVRSPQGAVVNVAGHD
jgi:catechol 2,3-dioxygenase-like lactoylglutathione lyase family enzyme